MSVSACERSCSQSLRRVVTGGTIQYCREVYSVSANNSWREQVLRPNRKACGTVIEKVVKPDWKFLPDTLGVTDDIDFAGNSLTCITDTRIRLDRINPLLLVSSSLDGEPRPSTMRRME